MRTKLVIASLLGLAAIAWAAPPSSIYVDPAATEHELSPCTGTGAPPDAGTTGGFTFTSSGLLRITGSDAIVCFGDGGTLADGCLDGGTCFCSSGGRRFPQGTILLVAPKGGRSTINCRSDGGAILSLTPVGFTP